MGTTQDASGSPPAGAAPAPPAPSHGNPASGARAEGRPLRILQIYPKGDFHTGAAIQLRDLAGALAGRGHRVIVLTRPSDRWAAEASRGGFVHQGSLRPGVRMRDAFHLAGLLRRERIQVVHAHKGRGRTLTILARLLGPHPPLLINRGSSFPLDLAARLIDRTPLVDRVVAVCEAIRADLVRQGIPERKIEVVYSGTDTDHFDPARARGDRIRAELDLPAGAGLITQIGVRGSKGNPDVLRAFARVLAWRPDARLLLVGARPAQLPPLQALGAGLGLGGALTLWGYRDDISDILAASDVCVDASAVGLGITGTLREALAMETPVVAVEAMGNPELVVPERTGLLVPPGDPEALGSAMLRLLGDRAWATALGRAGRRLVREQFSTEVKVRRLEALYERLSAPRRRGSAG
ncbi:MAG TPA: glycosyltransferase family 4 protein [Candidatus Binatia bacterium]|nr:glycosyltransferase family 4 protein [Candidatus Binatia bacterium]